MTQAVPKVLKQSAALEKSAPVRFEFMETFTKTFALNFPYLFNKQLKPKVFMPWTHFEFK